MAKKIKLLKKSSKLEADQKKNAGSVVPKKVVANAGQKSPEPKINPELQLNAGQLESLITDASESETHSRGFMEPQATVKKKRGRPSKAEVEAKTQTTPETAPPEVEEKLDCAPIAKMVWGLTNKWWVSYVGDSRVSATELEIDMLGQAWGKVLEKHLPSALAAWGEEIIAVTVTANIGLRISSAVQLIVEEKKAQREAYVNRRAQQGTSQAETVAVQ